MFSVPVRNQTDNRSTNSNEPGIRTLTLTSQNWKRVEQSWVLCPSTLKWSWGDGGVTEDIHQQKNRPPGTQWVGQSQCPMTGWDRPQVDAGWLQSAGRQVSGWANFHLLWWAFLPAPCFGISAWRFQQLQVGSGKGATVCGIFNKNFITQP